MRLTLASRSQGRGCRRISLSPRQSSWYVPARGEPAAPLLPGVAAPALPPRVRRARLRSRQGTAPCAEWGGGPAATCGPTGREGLLLPFWFRPNSERTCPGSFRHLQAPPGPPQLAQRLCAASGAGGNPEKGAPGTWRGSCCAGCRHHPCRTGLSAFRVRYRKPWNSHSSV